MGRRLALVWLVLFAAYAATLGLDAFGRSDYAGDEPHHLLTAKSLIEDGDLDVLDDHRAREYASFYPYELDRRGVVRDGRLLEPRAPGLAALIAPAYALAGAKGVELMLAAIAALAGALAYALALRVVPDPWALGAALAVGLSPPLLAYGTAVYAELPAAAALAGAALLALRARDGHISRVAALGCFSLLALLPWMGPKFVPAGIVVGWVAVAALRRGRRGLLAFGGVELAALSVAAFVGVSEALFGGTTPYQADPSTGGATGTESAGDYLDRSYRLVALFIDRDHGLLRWAPVVALAFVGLWHLWRARRDRISRALDALRPLEATAALCAAAAGAQLLVAAFAAPTMFGFSFPPRHLVTALPLSVPLVAWGLRHAPRTGTALATIGVAASAWLYLDVRFGAGGLAADRPDAPLGPLVDALPRFAGGATLPYVVAGVLGAAVALLVAREWRRTRRAPAAAAGLAGPG